MCLHYTSADLPSWLDTLLNAGYSQGKADLAFPPDLTSDMWPGRRGAYIRRSAEVDVDDAAHASPEIAAGRWGLISAQTRRDKLPEAKKLSTVNSRDDRVKKSFTFGNAWRRGQHCIVPAAAIFEPDYRGIDGEACGKVNGSADLAHRW
jgi:putative SOS response-associated peptidase YedK